jgi:hypothetical protein
MPGLHWPTGKVQEQHESQPGMKQRQYLRAHAQGPLPDDNIFVGSVKAEVSAGLWIARCPSPFCSGAVAVTSLDPVTCCTDCGFGWLHVIFPENKAAISKELERRPMVGFRMMFANWSATAGPKGGGETLAQLRKQYREIMERLK